MQEHAKQLVAIGEIGLDYHWERDEARRAKQRAAFLQLIEAAEELQKPIIIHSWEAEQACFDLVKNRDLPAIIFHCYTGSLELAQQIAAAGFFVSISTNVVFSKALRKIARTIPLESMTLETDSPFLDPDRSRRRNTPENILLSAAKIAEERKCADTEVLDAAEHNAVKALGVEFKKQGKQRNT